MRDNALREIYEESPTFNQYLDRVQVNARRFRAIYDRLKFVAEEAGPTFPSGIRILVLSEPYCADCVINLPLIARIAEASGNTELRIASRDKHPAIANNFPGRGQTSRIPTAILLDDDYKPVGHWSERSQSDHQWMSSFTQSDPLPPITLEEGMPVGDFAQWLERRFDGQLPIFFERNWKDAQKELRAVAERPPASASSSR